MNKKHHDIDNFRYMLRRATTITKHMTLEDEGVVCKDPLYRTVISLKNNAVSYSTHSLLGNNTEQVLVDKGVNIQLADILDCPSFSCSVVGKFLKEISDENQHNCIIKLTKDPVGLGYNRTTYTIKGYSNELGE